MLVYHWCFKYTLVQNGYSLEEHFRSFDGFSADIWYRYKLISLYFLIITSTFLDPRMDLFLLRAPVQLITTIALYLAIIYKIGPNFMKDRKPFNLRNILIAYNIAQIIFNLVVFVIVNRQNPSFLQLQMSGFADCSVRTRQKRFLRSMWSWGESKIFTDCCGTLFLPVVKILRFGRNCTLNNIFF